MLVMDRSKHDSIDLARREANHLAHQLASRRTTPRRTPMDAFALHDRDGIGHLDRAQLRSALTDLGHDAHGAALFGLLRRDASLDLSNDALYDFNDFRRVIAAAESRG
jgi:Ca2+-binding EF-hand superfamily protein